MLTPNPARKIVVQAQASTLYFKGGYGISKTEAREILIETGPYAQYNSAVFVTFIPKGGRTPRSFVQTFRPDLVVLPGWGHFSPDDSMLPAEDAGNGVSISKGRYTSCDPRWASDFGGKLSAYLSAKGVGTLADMRQHDTGTR